MATSKRTGGPFWQPCIDCGDNAQASLIRSGEPIRCEWCANEAGQERLPQPSKTEKQRFIATTDHKKVTVRQAAKAQAKISAKAAKPKAARKSA